MNARLATALLFLCAIPLALAAQQSSSAPGDEGPTPMTPQLQKKLQEQNQPANTPPPRTDKSAPPLGPNESSSESSRGDTRPPMADSWAHPEGGHIADEALGTHEWNPMRAMKDVEVGDYYYKAGNYKAATSRYREALLYKPRDAVATLALARSLEKSKNFAEARQRYQEYLGILKDGRGAEEAKKALERLNR